MSFGKRRNSFHGSPPPVSGGVGVVEVGGGDGGLYGCQLIITGDNDDAQVGGGSGGQDHQPGRPLPPPWYRWPSAGPQMRPRKAEQDGEGLQKVHAQSSISGLFLTASKTCEVYNENR